MIKTLLVPLVLFVICCAGAPGTAAATPAESVLDQREATFDFRSNFWVNLDSFLYEEATPESQRSKRMSSVRHTPLAPLTLAENQAWERALSFYRDHIISRPRDSREMVGIGLALSNVSEGETPPMQGLGPDLRPILLSVAEIYRKRFWPAHDAANRFWIDAALPLTKALGARMSKRLSAAYQTSWRAEPIRVDVSVYANWYGAYTTDDGPGHVVMSSTDPNYQGFATLEMLYHEASHILVFPHQGAIGRRLVAAAGQRGHAVPRDLWHVIIFFTSAAAAKEAYATVSVRYDSPSDHAGLWNDRGPWTDLHAACDLYWSRYLEGQLSIDTAIGEMTAAFYGRKEG